ncbi:hypothetical protein [Streptomyces sp. MBT60]|nr:hypothetical protein [Streptomyces sp. MBT60]
MTLDQARHLYREQGGFAADKADWLYGLTSYDGGKAPPTSPST